MISYKVHLPNRPVVVKGGSTITKGHKLIRRLKQGLIYFSSRVVRYFVEPARVARVVPLLLEDYSETITAVL